MRLNLHETADVVIMTGMESLDVFDENYRPLEPPVARIDDVHNHGLWHQTFACWIVNPAERTILFQLRGPRNRIDPGSLDASASGHLQAGESPSDGFRELREELGIAIAPEQCRPLGFFRNRALRDAYINNEFCHVFLAVNTLPPDRLKLQQGEVSGVFHAPLDTLCNMLEGRTAVCTLAGIAWDGKHYRPARKDAVMQDLCNWRARCLETSYYLHVARAAAAFIDGRPIIPLTPDPI